MSREDPVQRPVWFEEADRRLRGTSSPGVIAPVVNTSSDGIAVALGRSPAPTGMTGESSVKKTVIVKGDERVSRTYGCGQCCMEGAFMATQTRGKEERQNAPEVSEIPFVFAPATFAAGGHVMDELVVEIRL